MKSKTIPNFFGVHNQTYLRTIPYRTHGNVEHLGLQCVVAREINTGEWAVLEVESGLRFGHAYDSKKEAIEACDRLMGRLTKQQIIKGMNARQRVMNKTKRASQKAAEENAKDKP